MRGSRSNACVAASCSAIPKLATRVQPYRGGLLPNERRQLERDLFEGRLNTIISTNALELGIDIGDLELCILVGHPGSLASFWQQAGRVGRKGTAATIVFIAKDTPIDQYLVNHSSFLTERPVERAWLNADNPYILSSTSPALPTSTHSAMKSLGSPSSTTRLRARSSPRKRPSFPTTTRGATPCATTPPAG